MRMRSRWRLSVVLILASTSVATWLLVNRQSGATADTSAMTRPSTIPVKPATVTTGLALTSTQPSTMATTLPIPISTTFPTTTTSPTSKPAAAAAGDTTAVQRGTLDLAFDFDGVLEPVDPFELRIKVRNYQGDFVVQKSVGPGVKVSKGDLLLELDPRKIDVEIASAENDLTAARANLAKAESDVKLGDSADTLAMTTAKNDLQFSQTELKRWDDTDGPASLLAGGMEIRQVQASLDDAVDELNELKKMYKSEDLTNQTADIVMKRAARSVELQKTSVQISTASADRALHFTPAVSRQHLVDTVSEHEQTVAQLEAAQTQGKIIRDTTLVSNQQSADEAARKVAELKQDRSVFSITSPIDGIVIYGAFSHKAWQEMDRDKLAVDAKLPADQVLLTVFTPGKLRVLADWPETQITLLTPGVKAKVSPVAIPELNYDATVQPASLIGAAKGDGQSFDVPMGLPAADARLLPGYKANVAVDAGKVENALLVPTTAVSHGKVWVHKPDGDDQVRPVIVGRTDGTQVEIKNGLVDGDIVLTQAKHPGTN